MDRYCCIRRCTNTALTNCRICSLPVCKEHQMESVLGPVCTRCALRLAEITPDSPAIHPTPSMGNSSALIFDPGTSAREILRDLANMLNIYGRRSNTNAYLVADAFLLAYEAADPILRKDRTPTEKSLIKQLCQAISVMAKPGYVFTENPDIPHYFGFVKEESNDR
jgi:hypothetical protein